MTTAVNTDVVGTIVLTTRAKRSNYAEATLRSEHAADAVMSNTINNQQLKLNVH